MSINARTHAKTLKADFVFGKTAPQEEQDFAAKTKFPVTLHALVPVLNFPLPSNRSRDTWTGAGGKGVTIGDAFGLHIEFDT